MVIGVDNGSHFVSKCAEKDAFKEWWQNHHDKVTSQTKQRVAYHFETNRDEEEGWIVVDTGGPCAFRGRVQLEQEGYSFAQSFPRFGHI